MNAKFFILAVLFALVAFTFATESEDNVIEQLAEDIADMVVSSDSESEQNYCVVNWARAQVGKAYSQVNRFGPNSFDCT